MTHTLEQHIARPASHPRSYDEMVIVSAGAPIHLSIWRGGQVAPTVVFRPAP